MMYVTGFPLWRIDEYITRQLGRKPNVSQDGLLTYDDVQVVTCIESLKQGKVLKGSDLHVVGYKTDEVQRIIDEAERHEMFLVFA